MEIKKIQQQLVKTQKAAAELQSLNNKIINKIISDIANSLIANAPAVLRANAKDLALMQEDNSLYDRLLLNTKRIEAISKSLQKLKKLQDPTGQTILSSVLPNGLQLHKITVPLGVVGAIYESRPNVTVDITGLCLKSRNAVVLKGSKDAAHTNKAMIALVHKVLRQHGINPSLVCLLPAEREVVDVMFNATRCIDVIIPRGSNSLIEYVRKNSMVPVIETGAGVCHVYVHSDADIDMAARIVHNAKTSRPSVCNAMDTLLVDKTVAPGLLKKLASLLLEKEVKIYADVFAYKQLRGYPHLQKATVKHYDTEFLSQTCAIKTVNDITEAMNHIAAHGTKHSESIVTRNQKAAAVFLKHTDAAVVYHNASTRFTDGEEFGLGAEIGISTQKLHARGPFALEKLVTEKWIVKGNGQVR